MAKVALFSSIITHKLRHGPIQELEKTPSTSRPVTIQVRMHLLAICFILSPSLHLWRLHSHRCRTKGEIGPNDQTLTPMPLFVASCPCFDVYGIEFYSNRLALSQLSLSHPKHLQSCPSPRALSTIPSSPQWLSALRPCKRPT